MFLTFEMNELTHSFIHLLIHSFIHSFVHSTHGLDTQSVPGRVPGTGNPDAEAEHRCQYRVGTPTHWV